MSREDWDKKAQWMRDNNITHAKWLTEFLLEATMGPASAPSEPETQPPTKEEREAFAASEHRRIATAASSRLVPSSLERLSNDRGGSQ